MRQQVTMKQETIPKSLWTVSFMMLMRVYLQCECDWLLNKIHFTGDFAAVITDTASVAQSCRTATRTTDIYRYVSVVAAVLVVPVIGLKEKAIDSFTLSQLYNYPRCAFVLGLC